MWDLLRRGAYKGGFATLTSGRRRTNEKEGSQERWSRENIRKFPDNHQILENYLINVKY